MKDYILDVDVRITVRENHPKLGPKFREAAERSSFLINEKTMSRFVGSDAEVKTLASNALKAISRGWPITSEEPPEAITELADVGEGVVTLTGTVHPHGVKSTIKFILGTNPKVLNEDIAYTEDSGTTTEFEGDAWKTIEKELEIGEDLDPETVYFYRIVIENSTGEGLGKSIGELRQFVTGVVVTTTTTGA